MQLKNWNFVGSTSSSNSKGWNCKFGASLLDIDLRLEIIIILVVQVEDCHSSTRPNIKVKEQSSVTRINPWQTKMPQETPVKRTSLACLKGTGCWKRCKSNRWCSPKIGLLIQLSGHRFCGFSCFLASNFWSQSGRWGADSRVTCGWLVKMTFSNTWNPH